jgi:hypothetical protein
MRESSASVFEFLTKDVSIAGSFHSRKSGVSLAEGDVLCAIDAGGRPTLLVPVSESTRLYPDWHSKSLALQTVELTVDGRHQPFMILRCVDPMLNHQFGLLADDVLNAIELHPETAPKGVLATLERWRSLFEADRRALLGSAQLAGLMAELSVLQELVTAHGPLALSAWQGPRGHRHDFVLANCSIEVKATTNHNNRVVTVHGGRQLSSSDQGELYLRVFQLERTPNGKSVPAKIDEIIDSGVSRIELLTLLDGVNYSDADSAAYDDVKFANISESSYLVDASFPRITPETLIPSDIIERLSNISYSIDLGPLQEIDLDLCTVSVADNNGQR